MEVHTHSHNEAQASPHSRKKFTHYIWDFLMLFLAVFCGFLAEYTLEHKIEKEKGKQFVRSFYEDLKTDTAEFSLPIARYEATTAGLQNRRACFESLKSSLIAPDCLKTMFEKASGGFKDLIHADQTLLQLKNAGGLRLLNKEDADSILMYDKLIRNYIRIESTGFQQVQYEIRQKVFSLFNYEWTPDSVEDSQVPLLLPEKKDQLNNFFNLLNYYANASLSNLNRLYVLKQKAIGLIEFFKAKYHFK